MLNSLRIVRGAVSVERLIPVLSHFAFRDGNVCGYDGRVYINAPAVDVSLNLTVPARPFLAAVDAMSEGCTDESEVVLTPTDNGRLRISRGRMRVTLAAGPVDAFPFADPTGAKQKRVPRGLLKVFTTLRPFIGEDASRPWSASIKVHGGVALATNNVALMSVPMPPKTPAMTAVIPVQAIDELIRIGEEPLAVAVESNALTFFLSGGVWLRTNLLHDAWPDAEGLLQMVHDGAKVKRHPTTAWAAAVEAVRPFVPDVKHELLVLDKDHVRTLDGEQSAVYDGFKFGGSYTFHAAPLLAVLQVATRLDLSRYPRIPWTTEDGARGVLLGVPQ